ncbi:MAG: RhuM family protein [Candidatus Omnitrophota bacterium]
MKKRVDAKKQGAVVLYEDHIEVKLEKEIVWLDTHQMADLFGVDRTGIVRHIRNIYKTKELIRKTTCAKNAQVAKDGKVREMDFYNLDMIISVGYRVNSKKGTQFSIWTTDGPHGAYGQGFEGHAG